MFPAERERNAQPQMGAMAGEKRANILMMYREARHYLDSDEFDLDPEKKKQLHAVSVFDRVDCSYSIDSYINILAIEILNTGYVHAYAPVVIFHSSVECGFSITTYSYWSIHTAQFIIYRSSMIVARKLMKICWLVISIMIDRK